MGFDTDFFTPCDSRIWSAHVIDLSNKLIRWVNCKHRQMFFFTLHLKSYNCSNF